MHVQFSIICTELELMDQGLPARVGGLLESSLRRMLCDRSADNERLLSHIRQRTDHLQDSDRRKTRCAALSSDLVAALYMGTCAVTEAIICKLGGDFWVAVVKENKSERSRGAVADALRSVMDLRPLGLSADSLRSVTDSVIPMLASSVVLPAVCRAASQLAAPRAADVFNVDLNCFSPVRVVLRACVPRGPLRARVSVCVCAPEFLRQTTGIPGILVLGSGPSMVLFDQWC